MKNCSQVQRRIGALCNRKLGALYTLIMGGKSNIHKIQKGERIDATRYLRVWENRHTTKISVRASSVCAQTPNPWSRHTHKNTDKQQITSGERSAKGRGIIHTMSASVAMHVTKTPS